MGCKITKKIGLTKHQPDFFSLMTIMTMTIMTLRSELSDIVLFLSAQ